MSALLRDFGVRHGFIRRPDGEAVDVAIVLSQKDTSQDKVRHIVQYLARVWNVSKEFVAIESSNFAYAYLLKHPFLIVKSQGTEHSDENFDMLSIEDGWELKSSDVIPDVAP